MRPRRDPVAGSGSGDEVEDFVPAFRDLETGTGLESIERLPMVAISNRRLSMKTKLTTLAVATAFTLASALFAQEVRPEGQGNAPQAQQVPDQPEIPTRTAATGRGEVPTTTIYTNPPAPAPVVAVEVPEPPPVAVEAPVEPAPAPVVAETTTIATEYEELPGSASAFPSLALGGLALIAAGAVIRRKR
jgi:hypothetical protein